MNIYFHGVSNSWFFVLGALLGYFSLLLIGSIYVRMRSAAGLGLGDAKLLAAAGAWLGPFLLAPTVFIGAILALSYVGFLRLRGHHITSHTIVPFGPFLSAAFFLLWCLQLAGLV